MAVHAPAHAPTGARRRYLYRLGLWLFILSEGALFTAFLAARFYLLGIEKPAELNQLLGLAITVVLLVSSLTAYRAETSIAYGDEGGLRRNLLFTLGLAALFLVGVGFEWREAFHLFPPSTLYGTLFFSLTGLHATHVLSGMVLLAIAWRKARLGAYSAEDYWGVEGAVKYWHFVDVAWVFIYPTLYLVA